MQKGIKGKREKIEISLPKKQNYLRDWERAEEKESLK